MTDIWGTPCRVGCRYRGVLIASTTPGQWVVAEEARAESTSRGTIEASVQIAGMTGAPSGCGGGGGGGGGFDGDNDDDGNSGGNIAGAQADAANIAVGEDSATEVEEEARPEPEGSHDTEVRIEGAMRIEGAPRVSSPGEIEKKRAAAIHRRQRKVAAIASIAATTKRGVQARCGMPSGETAAPASSSDCLITRQEADAVTEAIFEIEGTQDDEGGASERLPIQFTHC